jgi:hypothetical protein
VPSVAPDDDSYPENWGYKRHNDSEPTLADRPVSSLTSGGGAHYSESEGRWTGHDHEDEHLYPPEWGNR